MFDRTIQMEHPRQSLFRRVAAMIALVSLLSGCVVYLPPEEHYHHWR